VFFHAHPDDEAIATGGTMARAVAAGHRVVLVLATRGELGEPVPGVLRDGEELWQRRVEESYRSAEILGAARVEFLTYRDSGMMGEATNDDPRAFWQADVEVAAEELAAILRDEQAAILSIYDDHGGYGHPDHIQVHRVGARAAELAGVPKVLQMTMNRDHMLRQMDEGAMGDSEDLAERRRAMDMDTFGSPEALITHAVDVQDYIDRKRDAMLAHASQIAPDSFFLQLPPEFFARAFGSEWYIELGRERSHEDPFVDDIFG
jgi:LmbE family N-acetylglucosaminyl deacetylase